MPLTDAQQADFSVYARRPETWLEGSRRHLAVFEILTDRIDALNMQTGRSQDEFSGCFYAAYLHAGLAVENAVKAIIVARNPEIIQGGRVDRKQLGKRSGHAFVQHTESALGVLTQTERDVLFKLEEHVVWAGKYTVPMNADVLYDTQSMHVLRNAPMNEREIIRSLVERLQSHGRAA